MKSGFVAIIGRPNVGKSTLINTIIEKKVAITSSKAQTTRNIIQGIYNDNDSQIIFVDTPGIHKPIQRLGKILNEQAYKSINMVDVVVLVMDAKEEVGGGDLFLFNRLKTLDKPVILLLNKVDKMSNDDIMKAISDRIKHFDFADVIPVSALRNKNVDTFINVIKKYMKHDIEFYDKDSYTNKSVRFLSGEIVREKILRKTKEEVPHSVTCYVEKFEYVKGRVDIYVAIVVDRDSLKKILIGKEGSKLKEIGTEARIEIEELLGKKVFLQLYVKTEKDWRDSDKSLVEFGFLDE